MYSPKRQKGNIAEEITVSHLKSNGFSIIEQNYLKKWGEIDIIAEKSGIIHFIEVKSSFLTEMYGMVADSLSSWEISVSREVSTSRETDDSFNPIWNMTNKKKLRLSRTIRTYLADKYRERVPDFQIDLITVSLDYSQKIAYIGGIENIILE